MSSGGNNIQMNNDAVMAMRDRMSEAIAAAYKVGQFDACRASSSLALTSFDAACRDLDNIMNAWGNVLTRDCDALGFVFIGLADADMQSATAYWE